MFQLKFDSMFVLMLLMINLDQTIARPLSKLMGNFRPPRHLSLNESANSISFGKNKVVRSHKKTKSTKKSTILPIIYPVLVTPNTLKHFAESMASTDQAIDPDSPITTLIKLIVKDNFNLNKRQSQSVNHEISLPLNQIVKPTPLNQHLDSQLNQLAQQFTAQMNIPLGLNAYSTLNYLNSLNQQVENRFIPQTLLDRQNKVIQLMENFNKSKQILKPTVDDRSPFNQSQLDLRNDFDYNFDYDTFVNKFGNEINYLDQFFRDESTKMNYMNNLPYKIETTDFENENQYVNETKYPIFFRDKQQFYTPKVYSTYLFPVYTPIHSQDPSHSNTYSQPIFASNSFAFDQTPNHTPEYSTLRASVYVRDQQSKDELVDSGKDEKNISQKTDENTDIAQKVF